MHFRSVKERLVQSILYEVSGTLIATLAYSLVFGGSPSEAFVVMAALSLAFLAYAPLFNTVFDWFDWRANRRVASDRPHRIRILHAFLLEGLDIFIAVPILMILGGHSLREAIATDLALLALHSSYAYVYYLVFDRLRPIPVTVPLVQPALSDPEES